MEKVEFNGWRNSVRLANAEMEVIVTRDVGPRISRIGFVGQRNLFAEIAGQQGGSGEKEWMIRGGHRLWVAPEVKPDTYELDNSPVEVDAIPNGIRTRQAPGAITRIGKTMDITLAPKANTVAITHTLTNTGDRAAVLAPWALSVMAVGGMAIIPLPEKISHTSRLTHNQTWSLWGYTDFSDPRWTLGSRYVFFRQDATRGPNKLGLAHREGWVGYWLDGFLFVKRFTWLDGCTYPDGGMNFETFSNEDFLEIESLGPVVTLPPGASTCHQETWSIHRGVAPCRTEADVDAFVAPLLGV